MSDVSDGANAGGNGGNAVDDGAGSTSGIGDAAGSAGEIGDDSETYGAGRCKAVRSDGGHAMIVVRVTWNREETL